MHKYEDGLQRCNANYTPLTPVDLQVRTSNVYAHKNKKAPEETVAGGWFRTGVLTAADVRSGVGFLVPLLNSDPTWNARPAKSSLTAAHCWLRSRFPGRFAFVKYPIPRQKIQKSALRKQPNSTSAIDQGQFALPVGETRMGGLF
ncbi:hypothetical protein AB4Y42_12715 [Paraburkholderia sp. EG286B]|uniref:hypothetical protein n=1 Tax=Paraburkholderia sp. EG286B TaxID=3237011 RepID=UPI0034D21FDA